MPVSLSRLSCLESLLAMVRSPEFEPWEKPIAQKILDLHGRGDDPTAHGIDLDQLPADSFNQVFGPDGIIEVLNRFTPIESHDEEDPYPPWSSGDLYVDFLADLTYALGDFDQAIAATQSLGLQAIAGLVKRLGDLRKGPKEREKEGLKRWFWQHASKFNDDFYGETNN